MIMYLITVKFHKNSKHYRYVSRVPIAYNRLIKVPVGADSRLSIARVSTKPKKIHDPIQLSNREAVRYLGETLRIIPEDYNKVLVEVTSQLLENGQAYKVYIPAGSDN